MTSQEECWPVITSFFDEKKLVRQQLDSFDRFIKFTIGGIILAEENKRLIIQSDIQYDGRKEDVAVRPNVRAAGRVRCRRSDRAHSLRTPLAACFAPVRRLQRTITFEFSQVKLSRPAVTEPHSEEQRVLTPNEARLRDLTYGPRGQGQRPLVATLTHTRVFLRLCWSQVLGVAVRLGPAHR